MRTRAGNRKAGLSLLEVILALSILAAASAFLAQIMHLAAENAIRADVQTEAELIAENVMNQVVAGVLPTMSPSWTPYSNPNPMGSMNMSTQMQWNYTISSFASEVPGMLCVRVSVQHLVAGSSTNPKIDYSINRWIIDPSYGLDTPPSTTTTGTTTGTSGTSTSGTGSSSTGGVQ
ncbi:MAG: prepilin-type N-terminal cleavage/methylation domain-containing protein [Pirellulales bacterium]